MENTPDKKDESTFVPKPGAVRSEDKDGIVHRANPGDPMYSTITMFATEYWDESKQAWRKIHE